MITKATETSAEQTAPCNQAGQSAEYITANMTGIEPSSKRTMINISMMIHVLFSPPNTGSSPPELDLLKCPASSSWFLHRDSTREKRQGVSWR